MLVSLFACTQLGHEWDRGGVTLAYIGEAAADRARFVDDGTRPTIAPGCFSACTLRADRLRDIACVTPDHEFHFHAGTIISGPREGQRTTALPYTPDMQRWIDGKGGLPMSGWLTMSWPETTIFWEAC